MEIGRSLFSDGRKGLRLGPIQRVEEELFGTPILFSS